MRTCAAWAGKTWDIMLTIYVDADACPVKEEIYRVARRYQMRVNGGKRDIQDS
jgi:hypothetical protein